MELDYYTPPSQEIFDNIKKCAIAVWKQYDDRFGYATEKIDRIKDIQNVSDNALYIVGMFDSLNKAALFSIITKESQAWLAPFLKEEWEAGLKYLLEEES